MGKNIKRGRRAAALLLAAGFVSLFAAGCDTERNNVGGGHRHVDADENGVCDDCNELVKVFLTFLAVNDLHGKFMDTDTQNGLDEFTTYIKGLYADDGREEILLSSGDMWQGTAESSSNKGKLMTEWMNDVGFVSMTLGNHEFDWGANVLTPNSELAEFPFLGINVEYNGGEPDFCQPSVVVERGGARIGIIGAIGDCLSSISGEFQDGLRFRTGNVLTSLVKAEATRLRNEEHCDFIVYSIHEGGSGSRFPSTGVGSVSDSDLSWYDTSLSDGYVDLVFEAHTHKQYIVKDEYGVYHMQAKSENSAVAQANVTLNLATGDYTVTPSMLPPSTYAAGTLEDDPVVQELFDKYCGENDPYAVIGENARNRNSDTIVNTVAELYYHKGVEEWGDEVSPIVCGGGYINARNPYKVSAGDVTYADLYSVLPFDNDIVLGKIKGSDLVTFLNRVDDEEHPYQIYTTIKAAEVDSTKEYYIIVDTYTSSYKRNNITEVARLENVYARDLLADYIEAGEWAR